MNLNLGCGDRYAEGWHNVDHAAMPHRKDESVDLRWELPWSGVQRAYLGHILEHLWVHEAIGLLERLRDCMVGDGEIMVVGPDLMLAEQMGAAGTLDRDIASIKYGGCRWPGDEHRWQCTGLDVAAMLHITGWRKIEDVGISNVPEVWPVADRGPQWQCAVSARAKEIK